MVKVSSFNAIGVFVKMVTGLISAKVIAVLLGTEGMALLGNLRNMLSSVQSVGTLGLYNGVVKYISENKSSKEELISMLSTAYFICFVVTMSLAGWLYFDAGFWNDLVFGEQYSFNFVFEALGLALPFYSANTLCLAIINGFSKYKVFILLNIVTSILGLCVTLLLIWEFRLEGAFLAIVLNPAISLLITVVIIMNQKNFTKLLWVNRISLKYIKRFGSYSIMALLSATALPWVLINIRNLLINTQGANEAGYWEAMLRISDQYMLFITTLLTIYLLPKLSEIRSSKLFKLEVLNFYKIILPVFLALFLVIYWFRGLIINVLFSKDFLSMEPLFIWQLSGDVFKIASLVIAYQLIAKKMFWQYIVTEVLSLSFLYLSSVYLIGKYGFEGASMAHFFNYVFYFLILVLMFNKSFFGSDRSI
nr:O-antigen translocase [Aquimarina sp. MMG016]